jgi:hypothetical protein
MEEHGLKEKNTIKNPTKSRVQTPHKDGGYFVGHFAKSKMIFTPI